MGPARPRLWIVAAPDVPVDDLRVQLGQTFDVTVVPRGRLISSAARDQVQFILGPADIFVSGGQNRIEELSSATMLLDATAHAACLLDLEGKRLWSSARFLALEEAARERIVAACLQAGRDMQASGASERPLRRIDVGVPGDAGQQTFEATVALVEAAPETKPGAGRGVLAVVVREATSEHRLRQTLEALEQAGGALVSFDAEALRRMNVIERLKWLEERIVQYCRDLLRFDHFNIRLIDERTGRLEMVMSFGLPQEAGELEILPLAEGHGISGYVAATGRSYICPDTERDPRFLPGLAGARSSLTVPLKLHDRVIGVFNVESERLNAFDEDDRRFAEVFARYVAIALHMLNLLVVERTATNQAVSGRVEGELSEPLADILHEAEVVGASAADDPEIVRHVARIRADVEAIRRRVRGVAAGPATLLGVEGALTERRPDPVLAGRRVLVADDEANIRRIIHDVLHNRGAEVVTCATGDEALRALDHALQQRRPFDLLISDIRLPDRNGYEVFAAARRLVPGMPVILMTGFGYDPHHSIVRASQEGLQCVLFKPFPVERLVEESRKAIRPSLPPETKSLQPHV